MVTDTSPVFTRVSSRKFMVLEVGVYLYMPLLSSQVIPEPAAGCKPCNIRYTGR